MQIRPQRRPTDLTAIESVVASAFAEHGGTEAFRHFRAERDDIVSLIAAQEDQVLGTVLFSPVHLASPAGQVAGMGLGQLAVRPDYQNQGIGTRLAEAGLALLKQQNCPFVIVVGHAHYYPRFGFEAGDKHDIQCQWSGIPAETFMVMFPGGKKSGLTGKAVFDGL